MGGKFCGHGGSVYWLLSDCYILFIKVLHHPFNNTEHLLQETFIPYIKFPQLIVYNYQILGGNMSCDV